MDLNLFCGKKNWNSFTFSAMKFINNFTATANQFLAVALLKKLVIK